MLAATCLLSVATTAQDERTYVEAIGNVRPVALPPGGDPPRLADGHIDFSGVWFAGSTGKANAWSVVPDEQGSAQAPIPFQPWAKAKIDSMSRTEIEVNRPNVRCQPVGTPGMFNQNPYPHQIISKPGMFVHLIESDMNWRVVHTDGRAHKGELDLEPLYNGDQVAGWEGDTLVIDTISLHPSTWIQSNGWFHGPKAHVIERLRRPSMNYLEWQFTVEDPDVLTGPWTSNWSTYSLGAEDLNENYCVNNENVEQLQKLVEIESAGN
jgi:hypothetical protein